jgi:transcriptional regulator with XRE-family HTH domain
MGIDSIDSRSQMRDFLTTRRAAITPEQAGLPAGGGSRRVAGLRREEVALLSGLSVDYYIRLERGNARGASDQVLDALARALQLTDAERTHLFDLARAAGGAPSGPRGASPTRLLPGIQQIIDAMTQAAAYVRDARLDVLAANTLGRAVFSPLFESPTGPPNLARYVFLDPTAPDFFPDWDTVATDYVALLRGEAGRNPDDKPLSDLIGELSARSEAFRGRWAAHQVRFHHAGVKHLHHPLAGDLTLNYEAFALTHNPGLRINAFTTEPGTRSDDALKLLVGRAAAHNR